MKWIELLKGKKKLFRQKAIIDYIDMAILERCSLGEVPIMTLERVFGLTTKARIQHTKKLLDKGYITIRSGEGKDHRSKYVNLTDKGIKLYELLKGG